MATIESGTRRRGQNGALSYSHAGNLYIYRLWINRVSQTFGLGGQSSQSRLKRSFYPRNNQVGDVVVEGQCGSQTDYQKLALFIRQHQKRLINAPNEDRYVRYQSDNPGVLRLMRLEIPSEAINVRGYISQEFKISKKGVFEPAPPFQFSFTVIFDKNTTNYLISHEIQKYFDPNKDFRITGGEEGVGDPEIDQDEDVVRGNVRNVGE